MEGIDFDKKKNTSERKKLETCLYEWQVVGT